VIVKLVLAYDGTDFHGWAKQPRLRTVQGVLEEALQRVLRQVPEISVAGRTDAGVHARGQVVSFLAPDDIDPERIQRAVNGMLAPEVVVTRSSPAREGFDARHSATAREYVYRIDLGAVPDPFAARFVWHRPTDVSVAAMRRAARHLLGEHDFASFCRAPKLPASTVRRLERLAVSRIGGRLEISAQANSFLHQMVRSLVGMLIGVGEGRIAPDAIPAILEARDRSAAAPVAPPHGLTLERVAYGRASRPLTVRRTRR
jgi:tRNA pseudouridine38-40 synthase